MRHFLLSAMAASAIVFMSAGQARAAETDMTSSISNPSFENGFEGWTNDGLQTQTNQYFTAKDGNTYVEKWVNRGQKVGNAKITQSLKGLQEGRYRLTASAGNIQQKEANSAENAGDPQTGARIFANNGSTDVNDMKSGYEVQFIVVDGTATIGFEAVNPTGNWLTLDNFRLYRTGDCSSADYTDYLSKYINEFRADYLSLHFREEVRLAAEIAVNEAEVLLSGTLDKNAVTTTIAKLESHKEKIVASAAVYDMLMSSIEYAKALAGWYPDDAAKVAKVSAAKTEAEIAWGNLLLSDSEILAAKKKLDDVLKSEDKQVYTAEWSMGDVSNPDNNYYIGRTRQSKNWILFWEKGYGENPKTFTCGGYTIDVDEVLRHAEIAFDYYTDELKFITRGKSNTDKYKMVIRLRYEPTEWEATGSGVDDLIGLLTLTPWAAPSRDWQTLYHEVGHCFQYQIHCDNPDHAGFMYNPGDGTRCAFWEQCAQWQAYKIMPQYQFNNEWFDGYLNSTHKHVLHETPRYNSFFIQDWWVYKHDIEIIARIWQECEYPEDACSTYMRLTGLDSSAFNDEMYDCAAHFATWDIPALEPYAKSKIGHRPQPGMTKINDYWRINPEFCLENTGHNILPLAVPEGATTVSACFEGLSGVEGYREKRPKNAEWRYGFVAYLKDGSRVYGDMGKSTFVAPTDTIRFDCPADTDMLFFVVSGGAKRYWNQAWDDNDSNDEQWPYQVRFGNTNLKGKKILPDTTGIDLLTAEAGCDADIIVEGNTVRISGNGTRCRGEVYTLAGTLAAEIPDGSAVTLDKGVYIVRAISEEGFTKTRKVAVR